MQGRSAVDLTALVVSTDSRLTWQTVMLSVCSVMWLSGKDMLLSSFDSAQHAQIRHDAYICCKYTPMFWYDLNLATAKSLWFTGCVPLPECDTDLRYDGSQQYGHKGIMVKTLRCDCMCVQLSHTWWHSTKTPVHDDHKTCLNWNMTLSILVL